MRVYAQLLELVLSALAILKGGSLGEVYSTVAGRLPLRRRHSTKGRVHSCLFSCLTLATLRNR